MYVLRILGSIIMHNFIPQDGAGKKSLETEMKRGRACAYGGDMMDSDASEKETKTEKNGGCGEYECEHVGPWKKKKR